MPLRYKNRQASDPLAMPTNIAGVTNAAVTVGTQGATQSTLAFDTAAPSGSPVAAANGPLLAPSLTRTSDTHVATPSDRPPSATATPAGASGVASIPIGTVIGVCISAFVAVSLIILLALWLYKRSAMRIPRGTRNHSKPFSQNRNARSEAERSRSRQEHWSRLSNDKPDDWESRYPPTQTREMDKDNLTSLSMFKKKPPSVHSTGSLANTTAESSKYEIEPGPFAQYHPQVANRLATDPPTRDFLGRLESVAPMSWGTETIGKQSYVSSSASSNAVRAIPTPPATSHGEPHRWESAEVEHFYEDYDREDGSVREGKGRSSLFEERRARRRSPNNPFFGGGQERSRSISHSRSRSRSRSERPTMHATANPFTDPDSPVPDLPRPHTGNSDSTTGNSERALQSLIAALEVTPDPVQQRTRIQSLQQSVISVSASIASEDADRMSVSAFPLPPTSLPP